MVEIPPIKMVICGIVYYCFNHITCKYHRLPWLVVPLSLLLLLVVRCLIVLLPCAFGMVALNLARLIILHGSVLVALVIYLHLPSFYVF